MHVADAHDSFRVILSAVPAGSAQATGNVQVSVVESKSQPVAAAYGGGAAAAVVAPTPDLNADGAIDILDLVIVASQFGSLAPNPASADVNGHGMVDISDIVLIGARLG